MIQAGPGFFKVGDNFYLVVEKSWGVNQAKILVDITADVDLAVMKRRRW